MGLVEREDMVSHAGFLICHILALSFEVALSGGRTIKIFGLVLSRKWMLAEREYWGRTQMCLDAIYQVTADLKALIMM